MLRPYVLFFIPAMFKRWGLLLAIGIGLSAYSRADSVCSDPAIKRVAAAVELFDRKEFLPSSEDLCDVVKREPECAQALWVQSFIDWCMTRRYYQDNEILKQDEMKRRALVLNPRLKDVWDQTASETAEGIRTQTFEHFDIRYFASEDRSAAWQANQDLLEIYNELGSAFNHFPEKRFRVLIYTDDTVVRHWRDVSLGGFFNLSDRVIRVRADGAPSGELSMRTLLRREFAKAYLSGLRLKGFPGWALEGMAEFYSHYDSTNGVWKDDRLRQIQAHFHSYDKSHVDASMSLKNMEDLYLNKRIVVTLGKYSAYLQAEAMVLSIAKDRGDSWIPQVVQRMRAGSSWEAAYNEVVGVLPETVLERFQKSWKWSGGQS